MVPSKGEFHGKQTLKLKMQHPKTISFDNSETVCTI